MSSETIKPNFIHLDMKKGDYCFGGNREQTTQAAVEWLKHVGWFKQFLDKLARDANGYSELATLDDIADSFERILNETISLDLPPVESKGL